ncbi:MAG: DUF2207 domain-containing protein [Planctomycetota bacterium]
MSVFVLVILAGLLTPQSDAGERILEFDCRIEVHEDTSIRIVETIRVRSEGKRIRRGIFREIPTLGRGTWGLFESRDLEVVSVKRDRKPERFRIEELEEGHRIRIGRAGKGLKNGVHTYRIEYVARRQLRYFDAHDELYWNVTGNGWDFPIDHVRAEVLLPGVAILLSVDGYTGEAGSREKNASVETSGNTAQVETTTPLRPREGLTIALTFGKGHLDYSQDPETLGVALAENWGTAVWSALFVFVAALLGVTWWRVGREPLGASRPLVEEPPEELSPAAARWIDQRRYDSRVFTAALLSLAAKNWIRISEKRRGHLIVLQRTDSEGDPLFPEEEQLLSKLLGSKDELTLSPENSSRILSATQSFKQRLASRLQPAYFSTNRMVWWCSLPLVLIGAIFGAIGTLPSVASVLATLHPTAFGSAATFLTWRAIRASRQGQRLAAFGLGAIATILSIATLASLAFILTLATVWLPVLGFGSLALMIWSYRALPAWTKKGREIHDQLAGLRSSLQQRELKELEPESALTRYRDLYPWAIAMGMSSEWIRGLESSCSGLLKTFDPWPHHMHHSSSFGGSSDIASSLASAVSQSTSMSTSGSSSVSGGGGGGFSGGGGGGGGGGGW